MIIKVWVFTVDNKDIVMVTHYAAILLLTFIYFKAKVASNQSNNKLLNCYLHFHIICLLLLIVCWKKHVHNSTLDLYLTF